MLGLVYKDGGAPGVWPFKIKAVQGGGAENVKMGSGDLKMDMGELETNGHGS